MLQSEVVFGTVRRELRRAFPGLKIEEEQILAAMQNEVLKRELIDSEEAKAATATLKRALRSVERSNQTRPLFRRWTSPPRRAPERTDLDDSKVAIPRSTR